VKVNRAFVLPGLVKAVAFFVLVLILAGNLQAQEVSNQMVAPDSTLILSVARVNGEIFVEMDISKSLDFDHLAVERKPEFQTSFSQCLCVSNKEAQADNYHIVKKDNYPYHNSADVYYRVKLITKDGVRIYSSVRLPAAGH
jgi:hypothetical protein